MSREVELKIEVCNNSNENIGFLIISNPPVNSLSYSLVDSINNIIDNLSKDIKVLVVKSEGGGFCAGADLKERSSMSDSETIKIVNSYNNLFNKIENLSIPTIAAIHGYALGGGLELALACDFRFSTTDSIMGFPETSLGIIPINESNECIWGCVDIDSYAGFDHKKLIDKIKQFKLPLAVCRSKSGGAHVFLFSEQPVAAERMRDKLTEIKTLLGYGGSEVFPKQIQLKSADDTGNFLNLPYFGGDDTTRYAFRADGEAATLEEFYKIYEEIKQYDSILQKLDGDYNLETLTEDEKQIFENFDEIIGGDPGFTRTGQIVLGPEKYRGVMEGVFITQNKFGSETQTLTKDEATKIHPLLKLDDADVIGFEYQSGYCDPYLTTTAYAKRAKDLGVKFFTDSKVLDIRENGIIKNVASSIKLEKILDFKLLNDEQAELEKTIEAVKNTVAETGL